MTQQARETPRFSIIVPAYEAQSTLGETLDAILAQTSSDWECIVVDDGSTDDTLQIAMNVEMTDRRVRVIHQENRGTAGAYDTGVASAAGDFVVICSADDVLFPEHLSRMSEFIDTEAGFDIYTSNGFFWVPGVSRNLAYGSGERDTVQSFGLPDVIRRCFFSVGAMYRRELFTAIGGYRQGVYGEDYDFWLRAMASGARHRYLPEPLSLHRVSPTQKSAQLEKVYRSDIRLISDLARDFPLGDDERRAVAESVQERERLIYELNRPWSLMRDVLRPALRRIVVLFAGETRTRRLAIALRSARNHIAPR